MKIEKVGLGLIVTGIVDRPIVVIADVHGYGLTLLELLKKLPKNAIIIFVGDLIDRGPNSQLVVDTVRKNNYLCVKGNHEEIAADLVRDFTTTRKWNYYGMFFSGIVGGWATIESYGFHDKDSQGNSLFQQDKFIDDVVWMDQLPIYISFPEIKNQHQKHLVVSHSSAAQDWHRRHKDKFMFERTTLWAHLSKDPRADKGLRNPKKIENVFNVFGHTPIENGPKIGRHFAAIDNGVYSSVRYGKGHLVAYEFPSGKIYKEERKDGKEGVVN